MNFSKTTSYAISVLSFMARHQGEMYSAKKLHEILEIPWPYLRQLLTSLSKSGFLKGTRGRNPRDMDSIVDALLRLGQLAEDFPEIEELDINPLFVLDEGEGCVIGDARMILTKTT